MAAMGVCGALMKGMGTQTEAVSTEKYCSCLSGVPADMAKPYECRISPFDAFTVATGVQWCRANMPLVDPTLRPTASPTDPGPVAPPMCNADQMNAISTSIMNIALSGPDAKTMAAMGVCGALMKGMGTQTE